MLSARKMSKGFKDAVVLEQNSPGVRVFLLYLRKSLISFAQ